MRGASPVTVRPAPGPEDTTRVLFADPSLGESEYRTMFVDPGTAEIRGDLTTYGSSGALPMRTWISNLHRSLNLGEPGRIYSELAASWLGVVALGGLVLWIERTPPQTDHHQEHGRRSHARQRAGTDPLAARNHRNRPRCRVLVPLRDRSDLVSTTPATTSPPCAPPWLDSPPPCQRPEGPASAPAGDHSGHASTAGTGRRRPWIRPCTTRCQRIARADIITAPMIDIKPPAKRRHRVDGDRSRPGMARNCQRRRDRPGERDRSPAALDFEDFGLAAKLTRWAIAAHMGLLFGLPNQLVLLAVAAGLAAMVVWGYVMWWKRRPTRGSNWAVGRPAPRGAFLRGHWAGVLDHDHRHGPPRTASCRCWAGACSASSSWTRSWTRSSDANAAHQIQLHPGHRPVLGPGTEIATEHSAWEPRTAAVRGSRQARLLLEVT